MPLHLGTPSRRMGLRGAAVALVTGAMLAACSPTEFLEVTDPDIINPRDVSTPSGADAVRIGALARFSTATSGNESFFLLGGLFADEYNNSDTFIDRQQIDQRITNLDNSFLTSAVRYNHRARLSAMQAVPLLQQFKQGGPARDVAEMYFVQAYMENHMAEHMCNGLVFSSVDLDGTEHYGSPMTTIAAFERALAHADSGLTLMAAVQNPTAADNRILNALRVTKGRILVNAERFAEAATAVAAVPTGFRYLINHTSTADNNYTWTINNSARRYSVSNNEGGNGLNFATANDPRLPVCLSTTAGCSATSQTARDDNTAIPLYIQRKWADREADVALSSGIEARLIEAEAALQAGNYAGANGTLAILNALRVQANGGVAGLDPLTDPGSNSQRVDQLFRERAFWMFGTGHRMGDLRRLVRQYARPENTVFPAGAWHKGGNYGPDVNFALPAAERNNRNVPQGAAPICMDRNA